MEAILGLVRMCVQTWLALYESQREVRIEEHQDRRVVYESKRELTNHQKAHAQGMSFSYEKSLRTEAGNSSLVQGRIHLLPRALARYSCCNPSPDEAPRQGGWGWQSGRCR
jgi:hypothetical protein